MGELVQHCFVPLPTSLVNYIIKHLLNSSSAPAIGWGSKTMFTSGSLYLLRQELNEYIFRMVLLLLLFGFVLFCFFTTKFETMFFWLTFRESINFYYQNILACFASQSFYPGGA